MADDVLLERQAGGLNRRIGRFPHFRPPNRQSRQLDEIYLCSRLLSIGEIVRPYTADAANQSAALGFRILVQFVKVGDFIHSHIPALSPRTETSKKDLPWGSLHHPIS